MARETVKTYDDVLDSVRAFNKGLEQFRRLRGQIPFFQSWYYVPELDAVGPSKFIRYKGMDGPEYIRSHSELEGRVTDPVLGKWFNRLEGNSTEAAWVKQRVEKLVGRYGKLVNSGARFSAPKGWGINRQVQASQPTGVVAASSTNVTSITDFMSPAVIDVWRGFLNLNAEDQKALAKLINSHNS